MVEGPHPRQRTDSAKGRPWFKARSRDASRRSACPPGCRLRRRRPPRPRPPLRRDRGLGPSPLVPTAEPEQAENGKDERDEAIADAVGRPHRGVGEAGRVEHAPGADRQHAGQLHRAGQDRDPACGPAAVDEGDRGDDVDHAGEGRQHIGDRGAAELRRDLRPGPCAGGEREEAVDGDQQPARAGLGRLRRRRCRSRAMPRSRARPRAQTWMTAQISCSRTISTAAASPATA